MSVTQTSPSTPVQAQSKVNQMIKLAVLAVGGQGGGVLTSWIESMVRAQGWAVQTTSVAGVAQRTGSTIYYIEMMKSSSTPPVFALAPSPGDLDILIASEMMEVGRAIQRGFVTPDRTTLVGSTHRALAVSEKMVPGDGIASSAAVQAAAEIAARQLILADFEQVAVTAGSVISASLFGALAGSHALPFPRTAFEDAIRAGGKGVEPSLKAFSAGFATADQPVQLVIQAAPKQKQYQVFGPVKKVSQWAALTQRVENLPALLHPMVFAGLRKVVLFQDVAYGADYLNKIEHVIQFDHPSSEFEFTRQAAKYVANAMAYDDVIRVAEEKTNPARMTRIMAEMGGNEVLQLTDYTHPRGGEIVSLLPAWLGRWIYARPRVLAWIDRRVNKGRRLRTDRLWPFLQLWLIAELKPLRRLNHRHSVEMKHLSEWLQQATHYVQINPKLGVQVLKVRRLVKGYSDTHGRGLSKFDRVMKAIAHIANQPDAADWAERFIDAALADEEGQALDEIMKTMQ